SLVYSKCNPEVASPPSQSSPHTQPTTDMTSVESSTQIRKENGNEICNGSNSSGYRDSGRADTLCIPMWAFATMVVLGIISMVVNIAYFINGKIKARKNEALLDAENNGNGEMHMLSEIERPESHALEPMQGNIRPSGCCEERNPPTAPIYDNIHNLRENTPNIQSIQGHSQERHDNIYTINSVQENRGSSHNSENSLYGCI
ncbi:hypothetical protein SK128_018811, partial [Halocaridina rubra]